MKQEWFAAKELAGVGGLPTTPQGINGMARRESWAKRKRSGVQGRAVEYHIQSLPPAVLSSLSIQERSAEYVIKRQDPFSVWIESYNQLTDDERQKVIAIIMREGVAGMMHRLFARHDTRELESSQPLTVD